MAKSQVFQYVLFFNPEKNGKDSETPELIANGFVIARDAEKARVLAARMLDAKWETKIDDVEVLVRPF